MITVDGSRGEGGGQILRTSLALSACSGQPFRIHSIRKRRSRPGLARQHLTCVRAAAEVCGAEVCGATLRSTEVVFRPGRVRAGDYRFAIGTAGSANLVLQTVLPPLLGAEAPSLVTLQGGTHNDKAPPYHFVERAFAPLLGRMGPSVELELQRWGFYPAGGGELTAAIEPAPLQPLELLDRGEVREVRATAVVSLIGRSVARRELQTLCEALDLDRRQGRIVSLDDPAGPGNVVMVEVDSDHVTELFTGFGKKRVRAETVAEQVADEVRHYLDSGVPVGPYLADQLLLPLALAGKGRFRTVAPDPHLPTNAEVIRRFLDVPIRIAQESERVWAVEVG